MVLLADAIGLALAIVGTVIGIAVQLSAIGTMHATIVDRAPGAVARATGWTMTGYYLGALVSPTAFGVVADVTGHLHLELDGDHCPAASCGSSLACSWSSSHCGDDQRVKDRFDDQTTRRQGRGDNRRRVGNR